jgi:hypothetical protein
MAASEKSPRKARPPPLSTDRPSDTDRHSRFPTVTCPTLRHSREGGSPSKVRLISRARPPSSVPTPPRMDPRLRGDDGLGEAMAASEKSPREARPPPLSTPVLPTPTVTPAFPPSLAPHSVTPAKAGAHPRFKTTEEPAPSSVAHQHAVWIPACAGMTDWGRPWPHQRNHPVRLVHHRFPPPVLPTPTVTPAFPPSLAPHSVTPAKAGAHPRFG